MPYFRFVNNTEIVSKLTFFALSVLMMELLPTLGYPMRPTLMFFLSLWRTLNCLRSEMRAPLPKLLVMDEWKAIVGRSLDRMATHFCVTHTGTRSTWAHTHTTTSGIKRDYSDATNKPQWIISKITPNIIQKKINLIITYATSWLCFSPY